MTPQILGKGPYTFRTPNMIKPVYWLRLTMTKKFKYYFWGSKCELSGFLEKKTIYFTVFHCSVYRKLYWKLYRKIRQLVSVKGSTGFYSQRKVFQNLMPDVGSILGLIFLLVLRYNLYTSFKKVFDIAAIIILGKKIQRPNAFLLFSEIWLFQLLGATINH